MNIYQDRIEKLQDLMNEEGFDAIIVLDIHNYIYYTGDVRKQPRVYIPADGKPVILAFAGDEEDILKSEWSGEIHTYTSLHEMMTAIIELNKQHVKENGIIGLEFNFELPAFLVERFKTANPTIEVKDAGDVMAAQRMIKSDDEIENIKRAQEIGIEAMEEVKGELEPGIRECEVAGRIYYSLTSNGAEGVSFPIFVNSGRRARSLHGLSTRKKIADGDAVLIDIGPVYKGYCGNICRVFTLGKASEELRELIEVYDRGREAAMSVAKPGAKVMNIDNTFYNVLKNRGWGEHQIRGMSHGIGLSFEEKPMPTIFPEHMIVDLQENMVMSFGHSLLYLPDKGIAGRIEDVCRITKDGAKFLAPYDEKLIEL